MEAGLGEALGTPLNRAAADEVALAEERAWAALHGSNTMAPSSLVNSVGSGNSLQAHSLVLQQRFQGDCQAAAWSGLEETLCRACEHVTL
uniref:Uncharacterized protein n=1 Tax=Eutreptiella gymnastica TaxID=73025 RepID=A0A7S4CUC4_9EUGL